MWLSSMQTIYIYENNFRKYMYKDAIIYLERKYKRYKILESKYALQSKK